MAKYLQVTFNFEGRTPPDKELKVLFDTAIDWVKFAPNAWLLYTVTAPDVWYKYIKREIHPEDTVFICEIDPTERSGFLQQNIWDWLTKDRSD
ncbi:hypothetical protein AB7813_03720 [Tardiphaga sp. 20_F10_N6_6]|uniref:hypothetical protein n=1 Tax=Tardiphaga sp. 20_F10_N6_6 TaxID=3240788 RepID=UPI003F8A18A2